MSPGSQARTPGACRERRPHCSPGSEHGGAQRAAPPAPAHAGSGAWPVLTSPAPLLPPRRALARRAGSGKTLAFLLPLVARARRAARRGELGVKALVVSPTRELAAQTARALARLVAGLGLRCSLATAASAGTDFSRVRAARDVGRWARVWAFKRAVVTRLPALLAVSAGAMSLDAMFSWPSTRRQGGSLLACRAFAAVRLSPASGAMAATAARTAPDARLMRPRSQGGCRAVCMSRYRIPRLYVSYSGEEPMLQRAPDACPARRSMAHGDRAGKGTITSWSCALLEVPPGPANPPIIAKKKLMRQIEALHWS